MVTRWTQREAEEGNDMSLVLPVIVEKLNFLSAAIPTFSEANELSGNPAAGLMNILSDIQDDLEFLVENYHLEKK